MTAPTPKTQTFREAMAAMHETFGTFSDRKPDLIRTGLALVDDDIGGLLPGEMLILGGATGLGKSSLLLTMAAASNQQFGMITTEDSPGVVTMRYAAMRAGIDSRRLRKGDLGASEVERLRTILETDETLDRIHIAHCPDGGIESAARALGELGCRLISFDYLQDTGQTGVADRRGEINVTMRSFKNALLGANAAGVIISQFHRLGEQAPGLHSFKESGDIENKARVALILWQENPQSKIRLTQVKSNAGRNIGWYQEMTRDSKSGMLEMHGVPNPSDSNCDRESKTPPRREFDPEQIRGVR